MTWYTKALTAGQYPKTACGLTLSQGQQSPIALVAVSENFFADVHHPGDTCTDRCMIITPTRMIGNSAEQSIAGYGPLKVKVADLCPADGGAPSDTGGDNKAWCVADKKSVNS